MSKSILVIDTPCNCKECGFANKYDYIPDGEPFKYKRLYNCMFEPEHFDEDGDNYTDFLNDYMLEERKPEWCPLRELPVKQLNPNHTDFIEGYNKCVEEIGG